MKDIINNKITLYNSDCLSTMKSIENNSIDMILCDLPYGTTQNKWDSIINLNDLWQEYKRIIRFNGVIALTSQGIFTAKLILSNEEWFKYKLVWEKSKPTNFLNVKKQPLRKHEDICIFYNNTPVYNPQMSVGMPYDKGIRKDQLTGSYGKFFPNHVKNSGSRYPTDVIYFKTAESEPNYKKLHPTQKPVSLMEYLIKTYSNENDLILDNCMGSGTTAIACMNTNRRFIGIELDTIYYSSAKERILNETHNK